VVRALLFVTLAFASTFSQQAIAGRTEPIKNPSDIPIAWNYVGRHMAECLIKFDTSTFSITYVNSSTLLYDAEENKIHRNYNLWVAELINNINVAISSVPE